VSRSSIFVGFFPDKFLLFLVLGKNRNEIVRYGFVELEEYRIGLQSMIKATEKNTHLERLAKLDKVCQSLVHVILHQRLPFLV